jgi:hypothetical protein
MHRVTAAYTVKRVDGKLRQPDRMTQYSSINGMDNFSIYADQANPVSSDDDVNIRWVIVFLQS